ncbi:MAG: energy-coupling factor transporter transmembrane component T family protein [Candidatus Krumholzibacteriia bacterium]
MISRDGSAAGKSAFIANDPRFLIVLFALIVVSTFIVHSTRGLVLILLYVLLLHYLAGLPARLLVRRTRTLLLFVMLIVALNAFLVKGAPLPQPLFFLSREGLTSGIFYGLRVLTVSYVVIVFVSVASQEVIAVGLASLVQPLSRSYAKRVALHGFLAMGFLPLFADEIERIRVAQRFRGGGLRGGLMTKIAGVRMLFVPLVVSAIHRSGQLAMAVEIRGIRRSIIRLLEVPKPAGRDLRFAAVTLALLAVAGSIG